MEKRLDKQEKRYGGNLSMFSQPSDHSSPKHTTLRRSTAHSSSHSPDALPSLNYLKGDSEIQAEVDRQLRQYDDWNREDIKGGSTKIKSGRYRLGDQRVRHHVNWPHEFCSVRDNLKMPTYEDISVFQWVQGFARCVLEETDPKVRAFMLSYQGNLMQDALELNWSTAKRAHAAVLMEIERGQVNWQDQVGIDRIRQRFTQRAIKSQGSGPAEELTRICKRYNEESCTQGKDHTAGRITYRHACFACYRAVKRHYPHPESKRNHAKRLASQSTEKARV